jgi:CBS domain-containing protein
MHFARNGVTLEVTREIAVDVPAGVGKAPRRGVDSVPDWLAPKIPMAGIAEAPRTVPVSSLVQRAAVFCESGTRIREAAGLMAMESVTVLLVRARDGLGIVTDADLRTKVLAGELCPQARVSTIMTTPVRTIRGDRLAPEASIEMALSGVDHLVVVDAHSRVIGVISAADLNRVDASSPFALKMSISTARDEEEVVSAAAHLPQVFVQLMDAHLAAVDVSRVLALHSDALTVRLLDLAMERHGPAPVAYSWIALGSAARGELTLASDQDNALVYEDADDPRVDAYFARLAADVGGGLARCGFHADVFGVSAGERRWRMSETEWIRDLAECLATRDLVHLVRAATVLDMRAVVGDLAILEPFAKFIGKAPLFPGFLDRLARTATGLPSPLAGLRHRLTGPFDIKKAAARPIVNLARFHALANGVTAAGTLDRLVAVEELRVLDAETAASLREAFATVSLVRLEHHAAAARAGRPLDDAIDPQQLAPLARLGLQAALRAIVTAQKAVLRRVPLAV